MNVDLEKCTGCGECLQVCPVEAITMTAGRAAIKNDTCPCLRQLYKDDKGMKIGYRL